MHRRSILHLSLTAFTAVALAAGVVRAETGAASDGTGAFASKTDGMVSTVEGYLKVKDYPGAERAAKELTEKSPDYVKAWMLLGYAQTLNEKYPEANSAYDRAMALGAERRSICLRKAYNFSRMGKYDRARQEYRTVLEDDANDVEILQKLGHLEAATGNYDDAAVYYRRILDRDPRNRDVIEALAKIEAKRGSGNEARRLLEATLELDPENTEALGKLGVMMIKHKEYAAAIAPLEKLVHLVPGDAKARRNLGVAYYQSGAKSKAVREFERMRQLGGSMGGLYGPLADAYMNAKDTTRALEIIREGIGAGAQRAWLYALWGKLLEGQGRYDAAIAKFQQAVREREAPWSDYALKQIGRQEKLIQRAAIMQQQGMQ